MVKGWKPIAIEEELLRVCKEYYVKNQEELKLRHGVRSLTAFISYCIREYMKERGII